MENNDTRRKERQKIYQSRQWKDIRSYMKKTRPLCEDCLREGRTTPMTEIHHILSPFVRGIGESEKIRRAYDISNLVCLCCACHIRRHHPEGVLTIEDKLEKYK